jgi:putative spermidine/putrescine transport system substrate-binding protein
MRKSNLTLACSLLALTINGNMPAFAQSSEQKELRFPPARFDPKIFGGLKGDIQWYDTDGGQFGKAESKTVMQDFTDLTGVKVISNYGEGVLKFFAACQQGGPLPWSFVGFYQKSDLIRAAQEGCLEKVDQTIVPYDQIEQSMRDDYGIPRALSALVLAWNTKKYPDPSRQPKTAADFYDLDKFPGKRCSIGYAARNVEIALMADGVDREKVYPVDMDRALRKMDTIKAITKFGGGADGPVQGLLSGECDIALSYNGRVFNAVRASNASLGMTWGGAVYDVPYFAIPRGAPNAKAGMALLAMWALDVEGNKKLVTQVPYPTPIKALPLSDYPGAVQPWLAYGANLSTSIVLNAQYLVQNNGKDERTFAAWLVK